MDLFTYLMGKNDKNLLPHSDLFSYLLGKNSVKIQTASGTEISIISKKGILSSLELSKLSTQEETPTLDNPQEVKTVNGYRNLFDISKVLTNGERVINNNDGTLTINVPSTTAGVTALNPNKLSDYCPSLKVGDIVYLQANTTGTTKRIYLSTSGSYWNFGASRTITQNDLDSVVNWYASGLSTSATISNIMITSVANVPYIPYGTNWIYIEDTNGTNTKYITLPLNDNEICGIGDYKDEYIVDKNGHCWLNKKIGKMIFDGTETWTADGDFFYTLAHGKIGSSTQFLCNYAIYKSKQPATALTEFYLTTSGAYYPEFSKYNFTGTSAFKTWLTTHNIIVYYPLVEENLIDLNYNVDMNIYKGANTITNSEEAVMTIQYY